MKLWNKGCDLDKQIEQYTVGDDYLVDQALVRYDCIASMAHASVLHKAGVLTVDEADSLRAMLKQIMAQDAEGSFEIRQEDEDCHTAIENHLVKALGDLGKKIHTARSRNDQVATALRLYTKDRLKGIARRMEELVSAMQAKILEADDVAMPGYTHARKAMPSTFGLWMGSFVESMADNRIMLDAGLRLIDQNPLGSGAGYGIPLLDIDRAQSAKELGFARVQQNPLYVQNCRGKFEANLVAALVNIMADLNKMAMDLCLFTMEEFGFFSLPEEILTGSSIMPQKRNPDVLEIVRARYHEVVAHEFRIRALVSNLMSGYNRDFQLTKKPLMESFEITESSLQVMRRVVDALEIHGETCRDACTEELHATEEALRLVKEGLPFRDAYRQVAESLRQRERGKDQR